MSKHSRELIADKIELDRLLNYLVKNDGVDLDEARSELDISKQRFEFFMACCRAACLATGYRPWFVNTDAQTLGKIAKKLKITQW